MNREEAKVILLRYRPHSVDDREPGVPEAMELVKQDPELGRWLAEHCLRQEKIRSKLRQIAAPAGLKEQIISERILLKKAATQRRDKLVATMALVAIILAATAIVLPYIKTSHPPTANPTLGQFEYQMGYFASAGYAMNLLTNDPAQVRTFLAGQGAPADYKLSTSLAKADVAGCAVTSWSDQKVTVICFRTGQPMQVGRQSDLWLFVVNRDAVKDVPGDGVTQFARISGLATVVWTEGDKLYFLGTTGDDETLRKFL